MAELVIFGTGSIGEVAAYLFQHDSEHDVVAFAAHGEFIEEGEVRGLPVIPFEEVEESHPPDRVRMFVAVGSSELNRKRERIYDEAKGKGYDLVSYVSSKATWWGESHGDNCFIFEDNTIQPYVNIGNNVILWSGNHIGHHSTIGDHCFLSSHVVVSGHVDIGHHCFFGVNATIRDHIRVGARAVIGAGTTIMKSVKEGEVYIAKRTKAAPMKSEDLAI